MALHQLAVQRVSSEGKKSLEGIETLPALTGRENKEKRSEGKKSLEGIETDINNVISHVFAPGQKERNPWKGLKHQSNSPRAPSTATSEGKKSLEGIETDNIIIFSSLQ